MTFFLFYLKQKQPICHLETFSIGLQPGASPRAHVHSLGEDQGSTNLPSKASALFQFWFFFFSTDKWMKTFSMCPSNPGTRYLRDLSLCNKLRSTLKRLLAAALEVQALFYLQRKAASGSHFCQSSALCSATQQNTTTEDLQGKIHLVRLTYCLVILGVFFLSPPTKKTTVAWIPLHAFMIQWIVSTAVRYQTQNSKQI